MIDFLLGIRELVLSKTAKDSSIVFLGNVVSSFLGIIFTVLAARFLGPAGWGIVAGVGNLIPIIVAFADLGLGAAVFQYTAGKWGTKEKDEAQRVYGTALAIRVVTVTAVSVFLILFSSWLTKFLFNSQDPGLIFLAALGFLGVALLDFQIFSIEARQRWLLATVFISLTNILRVMFLVFLIRFGQVNIFNVLVSFSGSSLIVFLASTPFLFNVPKLHAGWQEFLKKSSSFSAWMGGNKIVSVLGSRVDILILLQLAGTYEAGIYGAANRLAMGVPLILGSFATVLAARFASLKDKSETVNFFKKAFGLSFVIVIGLIAGIIVTPLIVALFGPEYVRSKEVLQWLFVAMIPFALSVPSVNLLIYHFKKPRIITLLSILQLLITVFFIYLYIPILGIFAAVWALGLSNILTLLATYYLSFKYLSQK